MCGIAGYIGTKKISENRIHKTLGLMRNRGPDNRGFIDIKDQSNNIALLHSRLSIIDLDLRSNQPFVIGDHTLIFNGEIYNYIELRRELKEEGVQFRTGSDTEVLLQSYIHYGERCVERFEGMWSFAIFDGKARTLFLSRDRFAEKPLYYMKTGSGIYFGSETKFIKALSQEDVVLNEKQLLRYMVNGYKSLYKQDETFYLGIKEVPYATNIFIDNELRLKERKYWKPVSRQKDMSLDQAISEFRKILFESIRIRLRSDVPIAFCLSGGVDSGALASIAVKHFNYDAMTFSIVDTDKRYNERENIEATINDLGCRHTVIPLRPMNIIDRLNRLIRYHDSPLYSISYYVHSFLSESISQNGYKVVCSGTGADELITGYYDHFNLYLYEMSKNQEYPRYLADWNNHIGKYVRNPYLKDPEAYRKDPSLRKHIYLDCDVFASYLKAPFCEEFTEADYDRSLLRNRMMNEMFHEGTRVILHEDDLNSMMFSVENRSPYLDRKLFEFSYSIPIEYLVQNGYAKYILREAVKGILNDKVRLNRRKIGFNASISSFIDLRESRFREYVLDDSPIFTFVKKEKIEKDLKKSHFPDSLNKFLFYFLNAKVFLEQIKEGAAL
ncbi:asparagine synthase (glutamine-hydrolyzing) [Candidatus Omnitrophota bacterium]